MPGTTELLTAAAVAIPSLLVARAALRSYLMRTFTGLPDLARIGTPCTKRSGTAVIAGGSIAGLVTARVLRDHFERVVVVEPEAFTFTPEAVDGELYGTREVLDGVRGETYQAVAHSRSRVWQYCAMHVFQILLTRFLRKMFSGFDDKATAAGIKLLSGDFRIHLANIQQRVPAHKYADYDHQIIYSSRRTFETLLRRLVKEACPSVEFVHGTVTAFNLDEKDSAIRSVSVRDPSGAVTELQSALVVDCTGNTQAGLKLLSRVVTLPPRIRQEYNPKMFYASLELPMPPNFNEDIKKVGMTDPITGEPADTDKLGWYMSLIPDPADDYRTLLLGKRDGDNIVLGVGGWDSEIPVKYDEAVEYARGIDTPRPAPEWFMRILALLDPVKDQCRIFQARVASCSRVCYEKAGDVLPRNFVAIGDSSMRLNPRLGEGVTKATLGAITLDGVLRKRAPSDARFGKTYFGTMAPRTQGLWDAAKWSDYGRASSVPCEGETLEEGAAFRWFSSKLYRVMARDENSAEEFWKNMHFLTPTSDILGPSTIAKVLWEAVFPSKI
ncbi:hypothetical protein AURDEDRAFT_184878 [Auricularia subglabra TFB-10046 SS5]|nr:hypothetical protein AURDEDRAFT_184878 [Auricularia subglabra TFB-10046 SS5]